jgi:hypothetical protein
MICQQTLKEFFEELKILREKYRIGIHGCGCCPVLYNIETEAIIADMLNWDDESNEYKID